MATLGQWVEGARPRTLPAAVAPVLAGTGVAWWVDSFMPVRALLALVVSLALQVGVNYANDYSDGVRGTDADRVGPLRLVGSGVAAPGLVKRAAFAAFGVAAVAGLVLVVLSGQWWLLALGAASILAAWFYTGGSRPYGYAGLGELFVFVFFGLAAVCGTTYVQVGSVPWAAVAAAVSVGALACAILVANNLRDIAGDEVAGKRTLAVRLGDSGTRTLYVGLVVLALGGVVAASGLSTWWALLGLGGFVLVTGPVRGVLSGAKGKELIGVLKLTGVAELAVTVGLTVGWVLGRAL